jgi:isopentenyl-diphosphate Delta-isomerase
MSAVPGDPAADVLVVTVTPDGSLGPPVGRLRAHQPPGILHLAVSVALVDPDGTWLLQRRAASKAAFPARWANSCCTHPEPGEEPADAAIRRVREELGIGLASLQPAGTFIYQAPDPVSGLVEYELDHVFFAVADTTAAAPDPDEIGELARLPIDEALDLVMSDTGTPWAAEVLRLASRQYSGDAQPPG